MPVRNLRKTEILQAFKASDCVPAFFVLTTDLVDVIGGVLVDHVVEPVGKEQVGVAAPDKAGCLVGVVIWKIVVRDLDIKSFVHIPLIFVCKGIAVVLRVPCDKKVGATVGGHHVYA